MDTMNGAIGRTAISTKQMIFCGIFAALITVGAYIKVPVPVCPFTLQFLFTALAGVLLGSRIGALAVTVYVVLGLIGVPVFTGGGGLSYVFQPTFGYLIGFIVGTYAGGLIVESGAPTMKRLIFANLVNLAIVYICGVLYLWAIYTFYLGKPVGIEFLLWYCVVLAIPGDFLLSFVAASLGKKVLPFVKGAL